MIPVCFMDRLRGGECMFPQPGQLTIGEELLGYHNNNMFVDGARCTMAKIMHLLNT